MSLIKKWLQTATLTLDGETGALLVADIGSSGLPSYGYDAQGQETYVKVLQAPDRVTHHLLAFAESAGALLSLDGGTTTHVYVPAGGVALDGLTIAANAEIHAKNAVTGSNYTNLRIMIW